MKDHIGRMERSIKTIFSRMIHHRIKVSVIIAMSSDFYKRTLLTFYMQHVIKLDVSFNLIYSFPMIASNIHGNP